MEPSLRILDDIRIASPCRVSWNAMTGDDRARYCGSCERTVYNLSALTAEEAAKLIAEREGKLCVRMFRRHDGTIITRDCPVGCALRLHKRIRAVVISTASWLGFLPRAGCITDTMGALDPTRVPNKPPNSAPIDSAARPSHGSSDSGLARREPSAGKDSNSM